MFRTANYGDLSSWTIFFVIALLFLNPIVSAVPISNTTQQSNFIEQDFNTDDSLPQDYQVYIDKRNIPGLQIDANAAWLFPGVQGKFAFGTNGNPSIQKGVVSLDKKLGDGGNGVIYESSIYQFNTPKTSSVSNNMPDSLYKGDDECGTKTSNVATKLSVSYSGCSMTRKISQIVDDHIPIYFLCTVLQEPPTQDRKEDYDQVMTVMEKLEVDVFDMWMNFRNEEFDRLDIIKQAAEGLMKPYKKNIIHTDIKRENMMLKGKVLKIIDWDEAIDYTGGVKISQRHGSIGYICPGKSDLSLP